MSLMLTVVVGVTVGGRVQWPWWYSGWPRQGEGHDSSQVTQRPAEAGSGRTGPLPCDASTRGGSLERAGLAHTVA